MQTLNAVDFAQLTVLSTDASVIVLELYNSGSSSRWGQTFPTLTSDQLNMLDCVAFLQFDSWMEAAKTFMQLTKDAVENDTSLISGTITLVTRPFNEDDGIETYAWDLGDNTRPVFNGRSWTNEEVVERL